jgi:cytochrome c-type biogenesis protein CcmH/NrfG
VRALADGGDPAKVHAALGLAAERAGDMRSAIDSYRAALRENPQRVEAANNLAWIPATASDPALRDAAQAISLAEGVARWNSQDPAVLDMLATAYAAAGRYDDALATEARALAALPPAAHRCAPISRAASTAIARSRALRTSSRLPNAPDVDCRGSSDRDPHASQPARRADIDLLLSRNASGGTLVSVGG